LTKFTGNRYEVHVADIVISMAGAGGKRRKEKRKKRRRGKIFLPDQQNIKNSNPFTTHLETPKGVQ
jgi:hypothetical protein